MTARRSWLDRLWLVDAPARRLGLLRALVGTYAVGYLIVRGPHLASFGGFSETRFAPVGVAGVIDSPLPAGLVTLLVVATILAGVAFAAGWRFRVSGPAFALLLLWVTTYRNSWGLLLHTENLLVLHVMVLSISRAADSFSLDARRLGPTRRPSDWRYGWPIRLLMLVTVLAYLVAGWSKMRNGGLDWVTGDVLRNQVANDNLRKLMLGDYYSPVGGWLVQFGWLFPPMALATMAIELGAPLAMLGSRIGRLWAGATWSFHVAIAVVMATVFPYQLAFVAFAPFFAVERGRDRIGALRRRRRARAVLPAG